MMSSLFCRYDLRTTDPDAARSFYSEVVGLDFTESPPSGGPSTLGVWLLHEQARSRGAPPYPTLRDPSGAVVAIRAILRGRRGSPVAWHHHHTRDLDRAWAAYSEVFGWTNAGTIDVADTEGGYRMFAWDGSGEPVGSMANTARMRGVHPHWLYFFRVADIDGTIAKVRARGGEIIANQATLPNGDRIVPCHDPQGGAFGLCQSASRTRNLRRRGGEHAGQEVTLPNRRDLREPVELINLSAVPGTPSAKRGMYGRPQRRDLGGRRSRRDRSRARAPLHGRHRGETHGSDRRVT